MLTKAQYQEFLPPSPIIPHAPVPGIPKPFPTCIGFEGKAKTVQATLSRQITQTLHRVIKLMQSRDVDVNSQFKKIIIKQAESL